MLVCLLALGQLQRISLYGVSLYLHDILIFIWVVYSSFYLGFLDRTAGKNTRSIIKKSVIALPLGLTVLGIIGMSWILLGWLYQSWAGNLDYWPFLYTLRIGLYGLGFVLALLFPVIKNKKNVLLVSGTISAYFGLILSWGWLQILFIPDTRWLSILGWDDHLGRMLGTQLDPNFFGLLLVLGWWWGMHQIMLFLNNENKLVKFRNTSIQLGFLLLFLVTWIGAISITWSRSTYLAFIGLALFFLIYKLFIFFWNKSKFPISTFIFVLISLLLFVGNLVIIPKPIGEGGNITRTSTITNRLENSKSAVANDDVVEKILGQGLFVVDTPTQTDNYTRENHAKLPTSFPIFLVQGIGIGGILILTLFTIGLIQFASKKYKNTFFLYLQNFQISIGALGATAIHSLANLSIIQPFIMLTLLLILGWEIARVHSEKKEYSAT